jgi:tRNA pseudouridine55 synthase
MLPQKPYNLVEGEIILINKPETWTSFDVINSLRYFHKKVLGIKKVKIGHTGTLDPLATGLLILCTGKFTKQIEAFKAYDKEYTGSFILGATTPSFDRETQVDQQFEIQHITDQLILEAATNYTGNLHQKPPIYSAVKVKGKRAYDYARRDKPVELEAKPITIREFEVTHIEMPEVFFRIACSKGTYIRALARDFGQSLQSGAYLNTLCRTRVGPYHLRDAWTLDDLKEYLLQQKQPESQITD